MLTDEGTVEVPKLPHHTEDNVEEKTKRDDIVYPDDRARVRLVKTREVGTSCATVQNHDHHPAFPEGQEAALGIQKEPLDDGDSLHFMVLAWARARRPLLQGNGRSKTLQLVDSIQLHELVLNVTTTKHESFAPFQLNRLEFLNIFSEPIVHKRTLFRSSFQLLKHQAIHYFTG